MKKVMILPLSLLVFYGCSYPNIPTEIKQKFAVCYTGKDTGIESHIEINGYYTIYEQNNYRNNMIFFKDGMFASQFIIIPDLYASDTCINLIQGRTLIRNNKSYINSEFYSGMYWIVGDTIKVRDLNRSSQLSSIFFSESWFKIIDRQTLQYIYYKPLIVDIRTYAVKTIEEWQNGRNLPLAKYHCVDSIPSSDSWLKEQKWLWCNEEDWKVYMENLKNEKKLKK